MSDDIFNTNTFDVYGFCKVHNDTYPDIDPLKANLSGKTVVITGASRGIGRATAISFVKAGCSGIAVCARSDLSSLVDELRKVAQEIGRSEPTIISAKVDVSSEENMQDFSELVRRKLGTVDVLINNAAYGDSWAPLADSTPSDWWQVWEVNIKGLYLCSKYFIPLVVTSQLKTILNLSSIGAHMIPAGASSYFTTKFAVCRLSEFIAADYANDDLISIALHPGGVFTDLARTMPNHMHDWLVDAPELGADFMVWLVRERRGWLKGRFLSANWDVTELELKKEEIINGNKLKFRLVV